MKCWQNSMHYDWSNASLIIYNTHPLCHALSLWNYFASRLCLKCMHTNLWICDKENIIIKIKTTTTTKIFDLIHIWNYHKHKRKIWRQVCHQCIIFIKELKTSYVKLLGEKTSGNHQRTSIPPWRVFLFPPPSLLEVPIYISSTHFFKNFCFCPPSPPTALKFPLTICGGGTVWILILEVYMYMSKSILSTWEIVRTLYCTFTVYLNCENCFQCCSLCSAYLCGY